MPDLNQFLDRIRSDPRFKSIVDLSRSLRAEHSARRQVAEHRVRQCEERLQALRQELSDEDQSMKEVENYMIALRDLLLKAPATSQILEAPYVISDMDGLYLSHDPDSSSSTSSHPTT